MRDETRDALKLFVEKAVELRDGRYVQWLQQNRGTALLISGEDGDSPTITHTRPDDDATRAFVLTLRFFTRDTDGMSFRWLAKNVLNDSGLSEQWKQGFTKIYRELNAWLDKPSGLVEEDGNQPTNRATVDTFIYGWLAHANREKKLRFERWKADNVWFAKAQLHFDYVLMGILPAIWHVARLNDRELSGQSNPSPLAS